MNIEREDTGTLTATLKVKLTPDDYTPGVEKALKEQRKQAALPGFRPGQVPMSIIRKRVGKAVLINEVERIVGESLQDYISTQGLRVLGQPLPQHEVTDRNNWDEPGELEFGYEVGLAPKIDVQLGQDLGVEYPVVEVSDAMVDKEVSDLQRRYGRLEDADSSSAEDMLLGDMIELGDDGSILEGGIMSRATVSLEFLEDAEARDTLVGRAKGDEVEVDPRRISRDAEDMARMLGVDAARAATASGRFLFRVAEIKRVVPAEVGAELFERVYGKDEVADEAAFRARVREGLEGVLRREGDRLFKHLVMRKLFERNSPELPDDFLKRFIQASSEKPSEPAELEAAYPGYAEGLKRQLVQDAVVEQYGLEAKGEELHAFAKQHTAQQFMQYGMPQPEGERLEQMAARMLGDREQLQRFRDAIVEQKLLVHFKTLLQPEERRMSYEEFVNLARSN
jgi:trigger factor